MKSFIITLPIYLFLLLATGSCKKEIVEQAAPNLANCRIVRTVYKDSALGRKKEDKNNPEIIKLDDGSSAEISTIWTTTYKYDNKNRLVDFFQLLPIGDFRRYRYRYNDNALVIHKEELATLVSSKTVVSSDTIELNQRGLTIRFRGFGEPDYAYNQDDQLLSSNLYFTAQTHQYTNGNLVQLLENASWQKVNGQWSPFNYMLRKFRHDITRPNLPVVFQFRGKHSRNLPVEEVWEKRLSSDFPDGPVYRKTFTYTYDKRGLVVRRVTHGRALVPGWLLEDDSYGIGVTDYEYECQ